MPARPTVTAARVAAGAPRAPDWNCSCGFSNFGSRSECKQCGQPRGDAPDAPREYGSRSDGGGRFGRDAPRSFDSGGRQQRGAPRIRAFLFTSASQAAEICAGAQYPALPRQRSQVGLA